MSRNGLPNEWEWVRLSDVADLINGDRGKNYPSRSVFVSKGVPFINAGHLCNGRVDFSSMNYISDERFALLGSGKVRPNDVLYCLRGSLGKAAVVPQIDKGAIASSLVIIRSRDPELSSYLYYLLVSPVGHAEILKYDNGTAQPNLSARNVKAYSLPLAPLAEQRRIVAKIEELSSDLDAGVAALERAKANLKRYRATVLKAAVDGKLTEEWRAENPDVEPASELLKRILIERRERWEAEQLAKYEVKGKTPPKGWKEKYKEPAEPNVDGLPELPEAWCWARLGQTCFFQNGRAFPSKEYSSEGVKLLRPGNLYEDGSVRWTKKNTRSMPLLWEENHPTYVITGNELIMNLTAQSLADEFLGRICLTDPDEHCLLNQRLARITSLADLDRKFTLYVLKSAAFRRFVNGLNTGSLIQHMFTSQLDEFTFPLPPKEEQLAIVSLIEERLSIGDFVSTQAGTVVQRASRLRHSILKRAFEGKLVPQDANDEPASELLAQIKAERETAVAKGKKTNTRSKRKNRKTSN